MESNRPFLNVRAADEELQQLQPFSGVTTVSTKPIGKGLKLNDFGVRFKMRTLNGELRQVRKSCSAELPSIDDAMRAAIAHVKGELGIDCAQELLCDVERHDEYSGAALEWMADWCENHPKPDTITYDMASAALQEHRASTCENSRPSTAVLHDVQLLFARQRAAQRASEKAAALYARLTAEVEQSHLAKKRPRPIGPEWHTRPYAKYETLEYWRQEEARIWNRRRIELSAGQCPS